ncbi:MULTISPECIES: hypothetical protein [Bacillus cereus group]|uniref:DUF6442 domain-containing protein n=1 Tax=Bacillus thuringiensis serovar toumanoffi TaxID=180862 RepID=A0ABD5IAL5_BACTU|nr:MULTISPECIES: hypothetical protein [Bacillus cereus group]EEM92227.1 hypothetical protein bthur0013_64770 [Bacillus thuringiensis IBL 200]MCR6784249.1 hypothetical protein [Bacillus thuringiensis]MCR6862812.1 hypothetical protein [Bacillus thuringiensis]MCR6869092.1 hypothetical protein [Bacillus thuringiensis]MDW9213875.1 DUF6442 domain-containing protein [Bacillus thuringiensis serovar toumanoffi]
MWIQKQDEMEKHHVAKASKNGFMVYTALLLIWSLYDNFRNGHLGNAFLILSIGNAVYFWTLVVQKRKIERFEETDDSNTTIKFVKRNKHFIIWAVILIVITVIGLLTK